MKKILFYLLCNSLISTGFAATTSTTASQGATIKNNSTVTITSSVAVNKNIASAPIVSVNISCKDNSACNTVSNASKAVITAINQDATPEEVQALLTPQFDFVLMTKYALGNNWKLATLNQQNQLVDLFKQLLIYTYITALSKFKGAQIIITNANEEQKKAVVLSQVRLLNNSNSHNQPVNVEYDLARTSTSNPWRAYDIKIENASLVTTYRNQFNDVIQSSKIDGLIKQLQDKIERLKQQKRV